MEAAVPGEIVDPGRGFEEYNRRALSRRRLTGNKFCEPSNFEIVEPASETAFEALYVKFSNHDFQVPFSPIIIIFVPEPHQQISRYILE